MSKLQFIVSTGDLSPDSKRAQRKLARSHVTAKRHFENRQRDVRLHKQRAHALQPSPNPLTGIEALPIRQDPVVTTSEVILPSLQWDPSFGSWASEAENGLFPALAIRSGMSPLQWDPASDSETTGVENSTPRTISGPSRENAIDDLRLEEEGGHLVQLPFEPSPFIFANLGQGVSDPFVKMPAELTPRISKHLWYYVNILMPKMHPSFTTNLVRRTFGCGAMRYGDELALVSLAAFAATSRALMSGDVRIGEKGCGFHESTSDWLYFKGKTINIVNQRISNLDEVFDGNIIGAISALIMIETFTGNIQEASLHWSGLRRIAAIWKSSNRKPMSFTTALKILTPSIKLATITQTKPTVPFTLTFNLPLPLPSISHLYPTLASAFIAKWPLISSSESLIPLLHHMAVMTRYTEAVFHWIFPYGEDDSYFEYVNFQNLYIEHSLLSYDSGSDIEEACRLVLVLYLNTGLIRGYPNESAVIRNTLAPLKRLLETAKCGADESFARSWAGLEDVLLWVLFTGAYCSLPGDSFFVEQFRDMVGRIGLLSWEEAQNILSRHFFVDRIYLNKLKSMMEAQNL